MTRTVTVTGGFSGSAVIDLTDSLGQLSFATFAVALTDVGAILPPEVGHASWSAISAVPAAGTVTLPVLVSDLTPPGSYNVAVDVMQDGRHEIAWVKDRRGHRALVVVT